MEKRKKTGAFLKQLRKTTFLTIAILFMLPLNNVKNIAVFVMVIAMGFISNTLNIVAIAAKKENNG